MTRARIAVLAVMAIAFMIAMRMLPVGQWMTEFQAWVRGLGALGYVVYVLAYAVSCVFVIPAVALTLGAGAVFGFVRGTLVVLTGATLGATMAFILARTVLRERVQRMTRNSPRFLALDRAITAEGTKIMWLVRISGFPPFTWVNYAFGLTGVRLLPFIAITFVGIIPGTLALTWTGAAGAAAVTGAGNRYLLILTAAGAVAVAVVVGRIAVKAVRQAGLQNPEES